MTAQQLNADISQRAVCDTGAMEWQQSPAPGCEVPEHTHPGGEELFVLEGGLEDQNGRYKKGCWGRSLNQAASPTPNWAT